MPDIWASKSPGPLLTNDADVTDDGETVAREPLCSPVLQALTGHKLPEAPGVGLRLRAKNFHCHKLTKSVSGSGGSPVNNWLRDPDPDS